MAYQFTNVARECREFGKASTRLVLMVLASCADQKGVCNPSYACLMHWAKVSKSTLAAALKELEDAGVLHRQNRYNRSTIYTLSIEKMEELRAPFSRRVSAAATEQTQTEDSDNSYMDYREICELVNEQTGNAEFGSEGRIHVEDVEGFVVMQDDPDKAIAVLRWFLETNQKGELRSVSKTFGPGVRPWKDWDQLTGIYPLMVKCYDQEHPKTRDQDESNFDE
jgi:DNA-binding transcriptional ArsR family regulator